jgi:hypothetical protein
MAFVDDTITWTTASGNKTPSIIPAVGDLLVLWAGASGTDSPSSAPTDNQGGTYDLIELVTRSSSNGYIALYVRTALVAAATNHIVTLHHSGDTGGGGVLQRYSGFNQAGSAVIQQSDSVADQAPSTTPTLTFTNPALITNSLITCVSMTGNPGIVGGPSGFAFRRESGYGSPSTGITIYTLDSGQTSSGVTWGSTANNGYGAIAAELIPSVAFTLQGVAPNIVLTAGAATLTYPVGFSMQGVAPNLLFTGGQGGLAAGGAGGAGGNYDVDLYGTGIYGGNQSSFSMQGVAPSITFTAGSAELTTASPDMVGVAPNVTFTAGAATFTVGAVGSTGPTISEWAKRHKLVRRRGGWLIVRRT